MPAFAFKAKSLAGEELDGIREARDKFELTRMLRQEGYVVLKAEEELKRLSLKLPAIFNRISVSDKMLMSRNLGVMIGAGLALARALDVLAKESANPRFKEVLLDVAASIRKGENFSQALAKHPDVFSDLFRAMTASGEKTGKLEEALKLISHQLKRDYDLKRKIRGALMYPAIVISAMLGIGILMMLYVVPTLVSTFKELNVALPLSTRAIIGTSNFLQNYYWAVPFIIVIAAFIIWALLKSRAGQRFFDALFLKIPVISGLVKKTNAARTARTLGSLIGSGVEILESLKITQDVLQNHYYKEVLERARSDIEKGGPISKIFISNPGLYPSLVGEMMAVGEETGKLSEMLFRLAVFYENEVAAATKDLSTIIEPVLMIVIGTVVGFFAISMIQPLYSVVGAF
ncbi:MAG: type II secretion system F family protein [bacterium]|nr:type II secretion system F family protein [bacterium]